jgi:LSD1 subclass zinc finger protein
MRIKERLYRFMYGRYGGDSLSKFTLIVYIIIAIVQLFVDQPYLSFFLWLINVALMIWSFFRMFSKNIYKRQAENAVYLGIKRKITQYFKYLSNKWKFRKTHVYKKCTSCKTKLRLPKKKGEHNVKCPKCSNSFLVKIK